MLALTLLPSGVFADTRGDLTAFDACVLQFLAANADNVMASMVAPIDCGVRHIPMRQSCTMVEYMVLDKRLNCETADLVFWQGEVARLEAEALADGRSGQSTLLAIGVDRCAETAADPKERETCLTTTYWREAMGFQSALAQVGR